MSQTATSSQITLLCAPGLLPHEDRPIYFHLIQEDILDIRVAHIGRKVNTPKNIQTALDQDKGSIYVTNDPNTKILPAIILGPVPNGIDEWVAFIKEYQINIRKIYQQSRFVPIGQNAPAL